MTPEEWRTWLIAMAILVGCAVPALDLVTRETKYKTDADINSDVISCICGSTIGVCLALLIRRVCM